MIECLVSLALSIHRIWPALESGAGTDDPFLNGTAIAIDVAAFGDFDQFTCEAERLGDAIVKLPRADGVDRILLPGERGDSIMVEREISGIPVPKGTWQRLITAAQTVGVAAPR